MARKQHALSARILSTGIALSATFGITALLGRLGATADQQLPEVALASNQSLQSPTPTPAPVIPSVVTVPLADPAPLVASPATPTTPAPVQQAPVTASAPAPIQVSVPTLPQPAPATSGSR